jgi:hypothetical protein
VKIVTSSLATCSVTDGGDRISLGLVEKNGRDVEVKVSAADACGIAMTLPQLLKTSLHAEYSDPSLRHVFPLDTWQDEAASDGSQVILTSATGAGFEVSFPTKPEMCSSLGSALFESSEWPLCAATPVPNLMAKKE